MKQGIHTMKTDPRQKAVETTQKIKKLISNHLGTPTDELHREADLRQDLNAEELEVVDLLTKLEKEFQVDLSPEERKKFKTVGDIIDYFLEP